MLKGLGFSFGRIAGMILGVLSLLIIFTGVGNVNTDVIQPYQETASEGLSQLQTTRHVEVGGEFGHPKSAFRQMVVYNMLSAANCKLVSATILESSDETDTNYITYFSDNRFEILREHIDVQEECTGSITDDITPGFLAYTDTGNANTQSGQDYEGRQGIIEFNVSEGETFTLNNNANGELIKMELSGVADKFSDINLGWLDGVQPDFWTGDRVSAYIPAGLTHSGEWEVKDHELYGQDKAGNTEPINPRAAQGTDRKEPVSQRGYSTGWIEDDDNLGSIAQLWHYRIRMDGVPIIVNDRDYNDFGRESDPEDTSEFEAFIQDAQYVFCEGAEGYVQTNAKYPNYGGEATSSTAKKENAVYPKVSITNGANSCIEDYIVRDSRYNNYAGSSLGNVNCKWNGENMGEDVSISGLSYHCGLYRFGERFDAYEGTVPIKVAGLFANKGVCETGTQEFDISNQYTRNDRQQWIRGRGQQGLEVPPTNTFDTNNIGENFVVRTYTNGELEGQESDGIRYNIDAYSSIIQIDGNIALRKASGNNKPGMAYIYLGVDGESKKVGKINWKKHGDNDNNYEFILQTKRHDENNWQNRQSEIITTDGEMIFNINFLGDRITIDEDPNGQGNGAVQIQSDTGINLDDADFIEFTADEDETNTNPFSLVIQNGLAIDAQPPGCE